MSDRLRIERVAPERDDAPGTVFYEVLHGDGGSSFLAHPFSRTKPSDKCPLVWQAEGPDEALTLTPSFRSRFSHAGREIVVHLFLRGGRIELCGDSTVELEVAP